MRALCAFTPPSTVIVLPVASAPAAEEVKPTAHTAVVVGFAGVPVKVTVLTPEPPVSAMAKAKSADDELTGFAGLVVMLTVGFVVSTRHVYEDTRLQFPALSLA